MGRKEYSGRRHLGLDRPLEHRSYSEYDRIAFLLNQVVDELKANEGVSYDEFKQPEPFPLNSSTSFPITNQGNPPRSTNDKRNAY